LELAKPGEGWARAKKGGFDPSPQRPSATVGLLDTESDGIDPPTDGIEEGEIGSIAAESKTGVEGDAGLGLFGLTIGPDEEVAAGRQDESGGDDVAPGAGEIVGEGMAG